MKLFQELLLAINLHLPADMVGYWENTDNAIVIRKSIHHQSVGEILWYTTGFTVGEDVWYNGELFFAPNINAYCANLYPGSTLWETVIKPVPPLGTVCIDIEDETLITGFSVQMKNFGDCFLNSFHPLIKSNCTGTMDFTK